MNTQKNKEIIATVKQIIERNKGCVGFTRIERVPVEEFNVLFMLDIFQEIGTEYIGSQYVIDNTNKNIIVNCLNWLFGRPFLCINPITGEQQPGNLNAGLFISGSTGTGKSVLLELLAALGRAYNLGYQFGGNKPINLTWTGKRADEICNEFLINGAAALNGVRTNNVVCINDVGCEPVEQLYMGNRVNIIGQILETRGDKTGLFTLISSNLPIENKSFPTDMRRRYGDRVASRLQAMCNYFILKGIDRRIK